MLRRCAAAAGLALLSAAGLVAHAGAEAPPRDFHFQTLGTDQGLAQNTVTAMLQDRAGFLWIGTQAGLQRFDGYAFRSFEPSADADAAPDASVSALAEDADGVLWIGTAGAGIERLDAGHATVERVPMPAGAPPELANIRALAPGAKHALWVGTDAGLARLDANGLHLDPSLALPHGEGRAARVRQLRLNDDGTLWIASTLGLFRLPADGGALERVGAEILDDVTALLVDHAHRLYATSYDGLYRIETDGAPRRIWPASGGHTVTAIAEDTRGRLWLAAPHEGLVAFDPERGDETWLKPERNVAGALPGSLISGLLVDRSGLLWVGMSERGLAHADTAGSIFQAIEDPDAERDAGSDNVHAIFEDATGGIWLGTDGDGLKRYDPATGAFDRYGDVLAHAFASVPSKHPDLRVASAKRADARAPTPDQAPELHVEALAGTGLGRLWVATNRGVALFDPARRSATVLPLDDDADGGLAEADVRSILSARDGRLWLGTAYNGLARYDAPVERWQILRADAGTPRLGSNTVLALLQDRSGTIWVGTLNGLDRIDPTGNVTSFRQDPADPRSLAGNVVRALHESADGTIWIGTQAGLNRVDGVEGGRMRFTHWLPRDGLPNGTILAIGEDAMGRLWLSSNKGLAAFDRSNQTFRAYGASDGLQSTEFNSGAFAPLRDGRLAFGGVDGLTLFSPQAIVASRYPAPVVFTDVDIGNTGRHVLRDAASVRMAQADRVVRFEFAALDFTAPERNRFMYQLEGFDERWIDAGSRHEATYTNLDVGRYRFRVRAANHDGYWNETPATLNLVVAPPWWAGTEAKLLYLFAAIVGAAIWWNVLKRRRQELARHQLDLREREDRLRLALWGSGDEFWDWDMRNDTLFITGVGELLRNPNEGKPIAARAWIEENVHPDDLPVVQQRIDEHAAGLTETLESEHRLRSGRGDWIWVRARARIVERDENGQPLRMCGTARNIMAKRVADREHRIAQEVIRSMTEALTVTDLEFRFVSVNPAFTRMTGWREHEVIGKVASLLNCSQHPPEHYLAMREALERNGHWRGELWQRRKDNEEFLCWLELTEVRDASGARTHFVGVLNDITDRKRAEQELRYLANYDTLTGLPNRTLLSERLGHAIIRARRGNRKVAVLFLDLDRFKHVNDSMGHAAGDRMLKAAGSRLRHVVREGDTVARLGGDEFTVVLEDVAGNLEAEHIAQKVIAAFDQPLELDNGQEVVISPSIGISFYPDHGQVPTDLLKFADTAMYQAKERGRRTYMVYTEAMDAAARLRATTVAALRKALERNEFTLVYQPKLSLLDERVTGVEALLRWRSEDLGNVPPTSFIPIAEETGMIIEIGDWVVDQACAQLARWRDAGIRDVTMSVNVSVLQLLRGELTQRLCDILAEHDVAPNQLELELTESMVMANAEQSITTLRQLKAVGVTLAIDDFGTGYSSLSYLKRLPIDTLKIDKEFVGDITTDPDDEAITATVITMAHSLGLNVVAEGVESAEQVEYLREQGCDEIQGHWLSLPLGADQCLSFLRDRAIRRRIALGETR
ncbi:MAG TPA: EAL domain-containing protein [Rhodanobacteraceae bacterium]|nr:EAL domain-containing protein [Rhodanobacteraceae bacterium]